MRYRSTRGAAAERGFADALLAGLAEDGGLFQPVRWPDLGPEALGSGADYASRAEAVTMPFVAGDVGRRDYRTLLAEAYAGFGHPAVAPLVQIDTNLWLMELFHGPTFAFKDVALQLLGRLFGHVLAARGERTTIIGATSGDTGAAAIEAVRGLGSVALVMLHPAGRVSPVQRRQMTTVASDNIHNVAIRGSFDDCQDLVKALFADGAMREAYAFSAVNSINWARVMAQIVYYVHGAAALGGGPVSFAVPSGNFGNVYAGWAARAMGLDIPSLIIGSNSNDILTRFFEHADMSLAPVVPTLSPSMDIQVSGNFERLLHDLLDRDGRRVGELLTGFRRSGRLDAGEAVWRAARGAFRAHATDDETTLEVMARVHARTGILLDPHSAVGLAAAEVHRNREVPTVALATAHPAKFPEAVTRAVGRPSAVPDRLAAQADMPERVTELPNDTAILKDFIRERIPTA